MKSVERITPPAMNSAAVATSFGGGGFERVVNIPRIRQGGRQTLDTLISEEALLFAKYLREEKTHWEPRIAGLP
jgi:hypothetical protein